MSNPPSFELQISAENRVLAVEGLNRDGRQVAAKLAVVGDDFARPYGN